MAKRIILVLLISFAGVFLLFVVGVVWQDYTEGKCYEKVDSNKDIDENSTQLLTDITEEEKEKLGISKNLIPGRRYYEMKKCVYENYVIK